MNDEQKRLARLMVIKDLGEPALCRRCKQEIWWDRMGGRVRRAWSSLESGTACSSTVKNHWVDLPNLEHLASIERWLAS